MTDFDLTELIAFHKKKGALVTIGLARVPNPLEYGVVLTDHDGKVSKFLEKPGWSEVFSDTVNSGIYVIEPEALRQIEAEKQYDFSKSFPQTTPRRRADICACFGRILVRRWNAVTVHLCSSRHIIGEDQGGDSRQTYRRQDLGGRGRRHPT